MSKPREIAFTITVSAEDNEVLEFCAGLLGKDADELLVEMAAKPISDFLKRAINDLRDASKAAHPTVRNAGTALALAREAMKRRS